MIIQNRGSKTIDLEIFGNVGRDSDIYLADENKTSDKFKVVNRVYYPGNFFRARVNDFSPSSKLRLTVE